MRSNAVRAIAAAGLVAGATDITAAMLVYDPPPQRILQSVASGLLGAAAYEGDVRTAALGLFFQFFIATAVAAVYWLAGRRWPLLVERPVACGMAYGVGVYFFMRYVVLPLSAVALGPFSLELLVQGVLIHAFCVGLPIALVLRRFATRARLARALPAGLGGPPR